MTKSARAALHRLHDAYGNRIRFITLYVREAHPGDNYPQPDTFDRKLAHARDYARRDDITWTVAVDDVDGALHRQLDPKPHAAYLVGPDGDVVFRSLWANEESVLREALSAIADGRQPGKAQRQPRLRPMLRGTGEMWRSWKEAGGHAKTDVLREAPPVYASARTADLLRPLPAIARGAIAMAAINAALVGAVVALRRLVRR